MKEVKIMTSMNMLRAADQQRAASVRDCWQNVTYTTIMCVVFQNMYFQSSCVINFDSLDLQNYFLNGQISYLRLVIQFKRIRKYFVSFH